MYSIKLKTILDTLFIIKMKYSKDTSVLKVVIYYLYGTHCYFGA